MFGALRRLVTRGSSGPRTRRRGVRNHCDLSAPRECPAWLLRDLRDVDPLYDCHYLGNGKWVIGRVVQNSARREMGGRIYERRDRKRTSNKVGSFASYAMPILHMQGFGAVALFEIVGEPDARIVAEARRLEYVYRTGGDSEFEHRLGRSDLHRENGVPSILRDENWDDIEYRWRHTHAQLFRGAHTVSFGGA